MLCEILAVDACRAECVAFVISVSQPTQGFQLSSVNVRCSQFQVIYAPYFPLVFLKNYLHYGLICLLQY